MFGNSMDLGAKRDLTGAVMFFVAYLMVMAGVSTVLVHILGMAGVGDGGGSFFGGGENFTLIGSAFVLWLGGSVLAKRNLTGDIMSIVIVMAGVYLAWTGDAILGLVPVALLTTMGGK